jgi:hypothetical protein
MDMARKKPIQKERKKKDCKDSCTTQISSMKWGCSTQVLNDKWVENMIATSKAQG